jgi:hypothetical protein
MSTAKSAFLSATLALLLVASGCSLFSAGESDSSLPPPIDFSRFSQAPPLLVGRWELRRSTVFGPGEPRTATPSTTGRTETLVFPAPPDSVRVYRNDTLYQHTSRTAFFEDVIKWGVRDDTLATSSAALDGPQTVYERVE